MARRKARTGGTRTEKRRKGAPVWMCGTHARARKEGGPRGAARWNAGGRGTRGRAFVASRPRRALHASRTAMRRSTVLGRPPGLRTPIGCRSSNNSQRAVNCQGAADRQTTANNSAGARADARVHIIRGIIDIVRRQLGCGDVRLCACVRCGGRRGALGDAANAFGAFGFDCIQFLDGIQFLDAFNFSMQSLRSAAEGGGAISIRRRRAGLDSVSSACCAGPRVRSPLALWR